MLGWRDCVVTLIDLVGIQKLAEQPDRKASGLMRKMHRLVSGEMQSGLPSHAHAYIWNDSVLLLAFLDRTSTTAEVILREVDGLKRKVDALVRSYALPDSFAISVKGKAFPDIEHEPGVRRVPDSRELRATIIGASSYAMANCFLIEERIGNLKKPWYVDSRLGVSIQTDQVPVRRKVQLLPGAKAREVYVYPSYLWAVPARNRALQPTAHKGRRG